MTDELHKKKPEDVPPPMPQAGSGPPVDPVAALEADLSAAREEAREAKERWIRERADAENLKKRTARERSEAVRFGNENLVRDLLPIVDNLERALQAAQGGGNGKPLVE